MFSKKAAAPHMDAPSTVISRGIQLEAASMTGGESVRIDGVFRGNIDIDGSLVLGDSGTVIGDITANMIVVAGRVSGNIRCGSMLHFASTAKVSGDIETQSLIVDEGSQISGRYTVGEIPPNAEVPYLEKY
ncbi:MAG: polymer-forming cytoskeletal protein [Clostridiales bacterium]|jgi:cytoskeletal protein CcmA (bactofilin family)|nr:polymer-forming cytoskeletal protein [Clostridiales bacterium]